MRCTACSAPVTPVVALDLDGTLGDYHGHLTDFACAYLGVDRPLVSYDGGEPHRDWFTRHFHCDVSTFREIKLAYRQGGMKRTQPLMPLAAPLARSLRVAGVEVWITTTRPFARFDRVDPDTREWLRRHDIGYDALLASDDKMAELAERVDPDRVIAVLDDQLDVLEHAAALFGPTVPILRRSVYNRALNWRSTATDLGDAEMLIQTRLRDWRRQNGD